MKKITIFKWIIPFFFLTFLYSCVEEEVNEHNEYLSAIQNKSGSSAANPENDFDLAGIRHNEILASYHSMNYQASNLSAISTKIDSIMVANLSSVALLQTTLNLSIIENILANPLTELNAALSNSDLSLQGKNSLLDFIEDALLIKDESYADIYAFIVSYESGVNQDASLTTLDKEVILIISSILRHSLKYESCYDDGDWDTSVGHITAAVKGAMHGLNTAVKYSVITGIADVENTPF